MLSIVVAVLARQAAPVDAVRRAALIEWPVRAVTARRRVFSTLENHRLVVVG